MEKSISCDFSKETGPTCPSVAKWKATEQIAALNQKIEQLTKERERVTTFRNELLEDTFRRFCNEEPHHKTLSVKVTDFGT